MRLKKRGIFIGFIIAIPLFALGCEEVNKTNESTQTKKEFLQFVQSKELNAIMAKTESLSEEMVSIRESQESYTNINDYKKETVSKFREYINHQEEVYNKIYEVDFKSLEMNQLKYEMLSLLNSSREEFELYAEIYLSEESQFENEFSQENIALYANTQLKMEETYDYAEEVDNIFDEIIENHKIDDEIIGMDFELANISILE